MHYYIIESATRGVYVGHGESPFTGVWQPRFSYTKSRKEGMKFYSLSEVANKVYNEPTNRFKGVYAIKLPGGERIELRG